MRVDGYTECELASFSALRAAFRARGDYEPRTIRVLLDFVLLNVIAFGGVALVLTAEPIWLRMLGMLAAVASGLGLSTCGHTASHRASSTNDRLNSFITLWSFGFMLGVSCEFWRDKHVRKHHHAPNVWGLDDDIDIGEPFSVVATKSSDARRLVPPGDQPDVRHVRTNLHLHGRAGAHASPRAGQSGVHARAHCKHGACDPAPGGRDDRRGDVRRPNRGDGRSGRPTSDRGDLRNVGHSGGGPAAGQALVR